MDKLTTALVDFHKSQCYFASTVQITALVLASQSQRSLPDQLSDGLLDSNNQVLSVKEIFNGSFLVALAVTGFLPVAVTLACIARHGRLSWYLIILSAITMTLATGTLAWSWRLREPSISLFRERLTNSDHESPGMSLFLGMVLGLCGSQEIIGNYYDIVARVSSVVWVVWTYCVLWLLLCLFQKLHQRGPCKPWPDRFQNFLAYFDAAAPNRTYTIWTSSSTLIWALCFAVQFYLFSIYLRASVIPSNWSFGQIIAITVWIPSLFEYLYIEYGMSC